MKTEILMTILLIVLAFTPFSWGDDIDGAVTAAVEQEVKENVLIRSDGETLTISVEEEGEQLNLEVDLNDGLGGAVAQQVIAHLKESGFVDGDSFEITEEDIDALDEQELNVDISSGHSDGPEVLIPIIAILSVFGAPVLIVYLVVRSSTRRREMFHETVCKLAESGKDLPEGLIERLEGGEGGNAQQKAAKLIALGVALSISLFFLDSIETASLGLIPLFIGVAQLWVWYTQQSASSKS